MEKVAIEIDGKRLSVAVRERTAGPRWIVALHGLQGNQSVYESLFTRDVFSEFSILTMDFVGFGDSDKPSDFEYTLQNQAKVVCAVLEKKKIVKLALVGHSFGAMVSTLLTQVLDGQLTDFANLEGNLTLKDCGESAKAVGLNEQEFIADYEARKKRIATDGASGPTRARALEKVPAHVFYSMAKSIVANASNPGFLETFECASARKLLVVGGASKYTTRSPRNTQVKTIEGATHFMLLEKPDETFTAVASFLNS